ncbi:MAG TPA: ferredoxin [Acidimicrobiales bacterium]|nr:ferredoxin [Acidimicrobiales bacterium]
MPGPFVIQVDRELCMGSGNCHFWAATTFDLGDDGRVVVLDPDADDEEQLRVAAEGCPVGAITVTRADPAG